MKSVAPVHLLLVMASRKKRIHNKALNMVVNTLADNVEELDKALPRGVKERYGRGHSNKESDGE